LFGWVEQQKKHPLAQWRMESIDFHNSFLDFGHILRKYGPSSHIKVIGSSSRSQEQKRDISYSGDVELWAAKTPVCRAAKFACNMYGVFRYGRSNGV